jgi:hypothetical protein
MSDILQVCCVLNYARGKLKRGMREWMRDEKQQQEEEE